MWGGVVLWGGAEFTLIAECVGGQWPDLRQPLEVKGSKLPSKYFCTASLKTPLSGVACANRVIEEQNFRSSGYPKISSAERPCTRFTRRVHSRMPGTKNWVVDIRLCFCSRGDRKLFRHQAVTQSFDLWKNEPHPMPLLIPVTQF